MFLLGFLAITGSPPFGPFISEFAILHGAFSAHKYLIGMWIPCAVTAGVHWNGGDSFIGCSGKYSGTGYRKENFP
jgi:formate hydrogenlyase subunit 3/multisubunit Na+/H+ antiporter MnhD subunit